VELHVHDSWRMRTALAAVLCDMILLAPNRFDQGGDLDDLIGRLQDVRQPVLTSSVSRFCRSPILPDCGT
jgi:hypothetical protein